jgi:phosphomannomutase
VPDRHDFNPTILREYDIRGVVGDTLTHADAYAIGRSFATLVLRDGGTRICIGYDGRVSSPDMAAALADGMQDAGATVLRIGRGPTPMLYYSVYHLKADGGIMVTGSHNPPDYNGFKMMLGHRAFFGSDIQGIGSMAAAGDWLSGTGAAEDVAVRDAYLDELCAAYTTDVPITAAWDCGNGATGDIVPDLIARLPGTHRVLFETVDGSFPNHHPDPTEEKNLVDIKNAVTGQGLAVGIAFDGDGDRIGVIDSQGRVLWGDQLLALLARDVLAERPGATIIADVKASQVLFDEIARAGGVPLMYRTGHSLIKTKMAEIKSPLAGEMSGHIFFADKYYGFDDALYVAVRFLDVLARSGKTAAELRDTLPTMINTPEVRFDCADERKFAVVEEVKARLVAAGAEFNDIDGVRVSQEGGWWLLRASNTQPALVVRCEAGDEAALARLKDTARTALAESGVQAPADF